MADVAPESHATGFQTNPVLRQRTLGRAATLTEGGKSPRLVERRSSLFSDISDTRPLSTRPVMKDANAVPDLDEPTWWYSAPLAVAILPAMGGLFFQNGQGFVTDILLLALAAMFLNWCVRTPWDWYHAAQQAHYTDIGDERESDTIHEVDEEDDDLDRDDEAAPPEAAWEPSSDGAQSQTEAQRDASRQLTKESRLALFSAFLGPALGAYLLHAIRSQLTRPAEGLVSNYNLTIFTMAAELRPVMHVIKQKHGRLVHLQRIVNETPKPRLPTADAEELSQRLADIEARLAAAPNETKPNGSFSETSELKDKIRQDLQPQLDALNRAVRRYEKRQVAQSIQTEARFEEFDARLKDALALAAAAARTAQRPGIVSVAIAWVLHVVRGACQTTWTVATYPYRVTGRIAYLVRSRFVRSERRPPATRRVKKY